MTKIKNFAVYLIAPILALALFVILFRLWNYDLELPIFVYGGDSLFSAFFVKNIIDQGWFFSNDLVGMPHFSDTFSLYDFPLYADSFNFFIIKILSHFSSNHFLIINLFFLLSFILTSATSFIVLRHFKISNFTAVIISVLYAFIPYHFYRSIAHILLSNYMAIPLIVMVALWIASDKIKMIGVNKKQQFCFAPNDNFWLAIMVSIFVAMNGIYYALYACVIFVFAMFLRGLKSGKFINREPFAPLVFCCVIIFMILLLYLPSIVYWADSGSNSNLGIREQSESEFYALRIINLFLPVVNHYLSYLQNLRLFFDSVTFGGERGAESLGILGATGFLFLLLWLVAKSQSGEGSVFQRTVQKFSLGKNNENLISNLASLNLLSVLYSTAGGLVMFMVLPFPLLRSHARFAIFIAFFSLFLIAIIFDKMIEKKIFNKKLYAQIAVLVIAIITIFDQKGRYTPDMIQGKEMTRKFFSDRNFVQNIEKTLPAKSSIFVMPVLPFPEGGTYDLVIGYIHSKNLRWSQPAITGRESYLWQNKILEMDFSKFISELKKAGFSGIYIDRTQMVAKYSWYSLRTFEAELKRITTVPAITSQNLQLAFYDIR